MELFCDVDKWAANYFVAVKRGREKGKGRETESVFWRHSGRSTCLPVVDAEVLPVEQVAEPLCPVSLDDPLPPVQPRKVVHVSVRGEESSAGSGQAFTKEQMR